MTSSVIGLLDPCISTDAEWENMLLSGEGINGCNKCHQAGSVVLLVTI